MCAMRASAARVVDAVSPGDLLVAGQALGEPTALLDTLFAAHRGLDGVRLFVGMSVSSVLDRVPDGISVFSFVGMGRNAKLLALGRLGLIPCHMSDLSWAMTSGPLRPDVALVLVSPPDSGSGI
jgi:hypothetical protein